MRAILIPLFTLLMCGCNSDIFVDDFTPDVTDITMSGSGEVRTIRFKSDDWTRLRLTVSHTDGACDITVTPAGGSTVPGNILDGDGTITVSSPLTDLTVTRRGENVTVDVRYAIGHDTHQLVWLTAVSDVTGEEHMVSIDIPCVRGMEIEGADYVLNSWGGGPVERRDIDALALSAGSPGPISWTPTFPAGIVSIYKMHTTSDYEAIFSSLVGLKIPVPTNTNPRFPEWALQGDSVSVSTYQSFVGLTYYPPVPTVTVNPGTRATLWADMETVGFWPEMTVRNTFTGERYKFVVWLDIEQPTNYVVTSEDI